MQVCKVKYNDLIIISTPLSGLQKSYLQSSLDHYKWLVEYCDKHQEMAEQVFSDELPLCKEMVELLPFRLDATAQQ